MISLVLNSEQISSASQSMESKLFISFLQRHMYEDYKKLYKMDKLVELIQECAQQQHTQDEKDAILSLVAHLHNSEAYL